MLIRAIWTLLFLVISSNLFAQINLFSQKDSVNTTFYEFELSDSSKFTGSIIFENDSVIQIKPTNGNEIRISKQNIICKTKITNNTNEVFFKPKKVISTNDSAEVFEDPTRSKLFLAPTAKNLNAGSVSIGTQEFLLPYFSVGITDWLSFSTSTYLLPISTGFLVLSLQANVFSYKSSDIAIGVLESFSFSFSLASFKYRKWKNYFYGVYTISNTNYMFNIGLAVLPSTGEMYPIINGLDESFLFFGGEIKVDNTSKIITDNWIFSNGISIFSLGLRSFTKSFSFDLGAMAIFGKYTEDEKLYPSTIEFNGIGVWLGFSFYF